MGDARTLIRMKRQLQRPLVRAHTFLPLLLPLPLLSAGGDPLLARVPWAWVGADGSPELALRSSRVHIDRRGALAPPPPLSPFLPPPPAFFLLLEDDEDEAALEDFEELFLAATFTECHGVPRSV